LADRSAQPEFQNSPRFGLKLAISLISKQKNKTPKNRGFVSSLKSYLKGGFSIFWLPLGQNGLSTARWTKAALHKNPDMPIEMIFNYLACFAPSP
jgi:hypothetical protein